jgi:uncharacterized membrane protein YhaH (DUF805 family)
MQWYLGVWRNYVGFDGRASRTEYWMFTLFNAIAVVVLMLLGALMRINSVLILVYELAIIVPSLAVQFRRLHDTGRSGWWMLITLVPFAGAIVLLVFFLLPSDPGMNRFGAEPAIARAGGSSAPLF